MQFALLIYDDEAARPQPAPGELAMSPGYRDFARRHADTLGAGEALQPTATATSVRVRDGEPVLSDGPFAETREQLGGFWLLEATDLDAALRVAAEVPTAATGCVEVRPVMTFAGAGA